MDGAVAAARRCEIAAAARRRSYATETLVEFDMPAAERAMAARAEHRCRPLRALAEAEAGVNKARDVCVRACARVRACVRACARADVCLCMRRRV